MGYQLPQKEMKGTCGWPWFHCPIFYFLLRFLSELELEPSWSCALFSFLHPCIISLLVFCRIFSQVWFFDWLPHWHGLLLSSISPPAFSPFVQLCILCTCPMT
ncbi:hypothetical protein BDV59DRAFT_84540 [Aspergillus ambiguus]|uniref:uncharacterized protein n=1 Tax=Aspergillus ambiguus TaxID=176160 RepID=UPI003CCCDD36